MMKRAPLNGWQRLWVVIAALWALPVLLVAWSIWPTSANLSETEITASLDTVPGAMIRAELTAAENATLAHNSPVEFWVGRVGGRLENTYSASDLTSVPDPDPEWLSTAGPTPAGVPLLSVREFAKLVKAKYPVYADLSDDVLTARVLAKYPQYRFRVDPRAVAAASQKIDELIAVQARVTTITRTIAIRDRVHAKRTRMALVAVAAWAFSIVVLYALGWSVGWVRRGFKEGPK
jgi:hypothetical protein